MINHLNNYQYIDTNIHTINKKTNNNRFNKQF